MSDAWSQLEQLLTCCICLDRYRSPKLLPCQHSFCEPCLDGLVDYARRQIKCPECRAEHRLPYSGDLNFPVNFTLMRFLELYQRLTGEEVEPLPSMLERCAICSEKAEVTQCAHCDKKVCDECKNAHVQIMQRELQRLNSQIRRALSRFNEELGQLKKCDDKLRTGCEQARTSIVELASGLISLVKEKEKQLLKELEDFQQSEEANLTKLKEGVDDEYKNLLTNCELIEKNVLNISSMKANQSNLNLSTLDYDEDSNELIQWSDLELVEYREIFLKTLEFLRNFETLDSMEYSRSGLKLDVIKDLDNVRKQVANYASLKVQYLATEKLQQQQQLVTQLSAGIPTSQTTGSPGHIQQSALNQSGSTQLNVPLHQNILMRSQSDHRLATQFAKKELLLQKQQSANPKYGIANYGDHDTNSQYGNSHYVSAQSSGPQYRSRFMREKNEHLSAMHDSDESYDSHGTHRVRFDEQTSLHSLPAAQLAVQLQNALKVFDTKEANRCPLSNVVKLNDSMHFMERIEENKRKAKKLEKEKAEIKAMSQPPIVQQMHQLASNQTNNLSNRQSPTQQQQTNSTTTQQQMQTQNKAAPNRQMSEDDIDKQKRLNKQFEMQSLNNNLTDLNNTAVNTKTSVQLVNQQLKSQPLQSQNSIHGQKNSIQTQSSLNQLVTKNLLAGNQHQRVDQASSEPDDEEDEEVDEESGEDESDEEDESALPGGNRQVISTSNKLSGQQRTSFEESESKLMPVSGLNAQRLISNFDQTQLQPTINGNSSLNIGKTACIDRDYGQSTTNYTSVGNKLCRQNSGNSNTIGQVNVGTSSFTPRNSIDIGSTGYSNSNSRSNSFDRENNVTSRFLTRANTRLDELLNRDTYANDNSTSSNHNRFNRFNRLARSSTVSSLSPSYTGTTTTTTSSTTGSNSGVSGNYRTYDLDINSGNNYLTGGYTSSSRSNTDGGNSYLNIRSRPSSPPPTTRSSTNASGLSRYGIGNSSVGTSSGYRRSSGYQPDTSEKEIDYKYGTKTTEELNSLLDKGGSSILDTTQKKENQMLNSKLNKQYSRELNLNLNKDKFDSKSIKESCTQDIYLTHNSDGKIADDQVYKSSTDEEFESNSIIHDKSSNKTDQILQKRRFEQRLNLYKNKGSAKLCIGKNQNGIKLKWPRDVCCGKFIYGNSKKVIQQVIIVCDSGNNRICCFTTQGEHLFSFGSSGQQEGQFDCPVSICCYSDGRIVVTDSNQNRLQWFDSKGNFLKLVKNEDSSSESLNKLNSELKFNSNASNNLQRQISAEPGQFNNPYGICFESIQNELYVCDKGNKRVQILDGETGNFKRFLGSFSNASQLNSIIKFPLKSPNFIASNGQNVIVSDTNNHCVYVLGVKNGRNRKFMLGGEGTSISKFKYPRGVALDEFGFIIVADSGNNRIQIFNNNGSFLKSFGAWGSGDNEFKGIEGLDVNEDGEIYVCDRENERIVVF